MSRARRWIRHIPHASAMLAGLALVLTSLGCDGGASIKPDRIVLDEHASGNHQAGLHGQELPKPLRVVVQGPQVPGLLGGKGSRREVGGAEVAFRVVDPASGTVFVANGQPELRVKTDAAGMAEAYVRLGNTNGDVHIEASVDVPDKEPKSVDFRLLSGVVTIGQQLEGPTGSTLEEVGLQLIGQGGNPMPDVDVFFRIDGHTEGAEMGAATLSTDAEGRAVTTWTLGDAVSLNQASATILDRREGISEAERYTALPFEFEAMAMSMPTMLVQLLGGLAIFIFGMKWMSGGLRRMADRRLRSILQAMTRNRFMSVGVGAALTAMVQSSSATTVMTIGFVNAGLLTLTQAIGVVYGANIGTTITAQIIAFKLDALAYPAIAAGLLLSTLMRRPVWRAFGEAVLGFGFLFLGMTIMSDVLKPLRHSPEFVSYFQIFDCTPESGGFVKAWPAIMCIIIGTITTVVVQSSSATVGLVLALSSQGLLTFYTAVPLVLGDNIGTTITALLASIGGNRNARRAAIAHTLFNVLGALYMYILLFIPLWGGKPLFLGFIDYVTPGEVFSASPVNLPRHVANAHTAFNLINCILFLPFVSFMARLCKTIVPELDDETEKDLVYLEPNLLQTPSLALQQAVAEVAYMLQRAQKSVNEGIELFFGGPRELEAKILEREELIDRLQHDITHYLVELSRKSLTPLEAELIPVLIHAVNDAERIGDHSEDLVNLSRIRGEKKITLSPEAEEDVRKLVSLLAEQFDAANCALQDADPTGSAAALDREEAITQLIVSAADSHVKRLDRGECDVQTGVVFLDLLANLERVGDHLVNIAERAGTISSVTAG